MKEHDHFYLIEEENLVQGTENWHSYRGEGIGASESSVIMGLSKYDTVGNLWAVKTGLVKRDFTTNPAIEHGKKLEPTARKEFIKLTGENVKPVCIINKEHPWLRASLDGISEDLELILEIKCPYYLGSHIKNMKGTIPSYYYCQVQHQLAAAEGSLVAAFFSYHVSGWHLQEVYPNEKFIAELIRREEIFWNCVETKTPPDPLEFLPFSLNEELSLFD